MTARRSLQLYTSLAPPSFSTQLIGTAEFAVIFRKYYPVRPKKLTATSISIFIIEQGRREVDISERGKWVTLGFRRHVKRDLRSSGMLRSADWLLHADVSGPSVPFTTYCLNAEDRTDGLSVPNHKSKLRHIPEEGRAQLGKSQTALQRNFIC